MCGCETSRFVRGDIQDKFILVPDPSTSLKLPIEIPLAKDGTVPLSFLERRFPGAMCLEYTNSKTGRKRAVMFDEERKAFLAPSDGWGDKIYEIIYKACHHSYEDFTLMAWYFFNFYCLKNK